MTSKNVPRNGPDDQLAAVARAIWGVMREYEDRLDMDLEDMGEDHHIWLMADAAIAANARLIAAAPDLLAALQFYANPEVYKPDSVGRTPDLTWVALEAIAKATS